MSLYHIRVCAVGSEKQLSLMLHAMLRNAGMEDEEDEVPEEGVRVPTVQELLTQLQELAASQGAPTDGFLYETICLTPFGAAEMSTATLHLKQHDGGAMTALFDFRSSCAFQPEDFLQLQRRCDGLLFCAQYADADFAREKGRMLLAAGKAMDNWDCVDACWFWLAHRYLCGESPEDVVPTLSRMAPVLAMEDEELTPDVLLEECIENLRYIAEDAAKPFTPTPGGLIALAEAELWDLPRYPFYISCLQEAATAWTGRI